MGLEVLLLGVIVFCGYSVGSAMGFGASLISVTLAANFLPIDFIVPTLVPFNIAVSAYLVIRHRHEVKRDLFFRRILPWAGLGMPFGLAVFTLAETDHHKWAFGAFVFVLSSLELVRLLRRREAPLRPLPGGLARVFLFGGGFIQGLWVSGGPLVAYWAAREIERKENFRATLAALWMVLNSGLLIGHLATGKLVAANLRVVGVLLPVLALAVAVGEWLHPRIPERSFRITVYVLLAAAGLSIILR
ncbi:MAG: sulfite exporter TauE/SafE family protein [Candidatus Lernaella stagnicola]|nr:sulfite exporter TauE/SafE family protein [Candidatus Lernaella stagnicola]